MTSLPPGLTDGAACERIALQNGEFLDVLGVVVQRA